MTENVVDIRLPNSENNLEFDKTVNNTPIARVKH